MSDVVVIRRLTWGQRAMPLLGLILLWPAIINHGAFFFPDTSTYVRAIDAAVLRISGHRTEWTDNQVERFSKAVSGSSATPKLSQRGSDAFAAAKPILLGRSPFYGVLLYIGAFVGSLWLTLVFQALLSGAAIIGIARHAIDPGARRSFAFISVSLVLGAALTPLPFFVSMLMPDFLVGLAVLAATALIAGWQRESWRARVGWFSLLSYAALAHSSHVLILIAGGFIALLIAAILQSRAVLKGAIFVLLAASIGLVGEKTTVATVEAMTGQHPIRPPFLTARLQEDGPATAFLQDHCKTRSWVLCHYGNRLPVASDTFLWSEQPNVGIFSVIDAADRRRLVDEQARFVWAVIIDRPGAVFQSSLRSVGRQLSLMGLEDFNLDTENRLDIERQLPLDARSSFLDSPAAKHQIPTALTYLLTVLALLISIMAIACGTVFIATRRVALIGVSVIVGCLLNDVICGALSTPHDRYQARVIWTIITSAMLLIGPLLNKRVKPMPS